MRSCRNSGEAGKERRAKHFGPAADQEGPTQPMRAGGVPARFSMRSMRDLRAQPVRAGDVPELLR